MGRIWEQIRSAVGEDRFIVSWHADERCEERGVTEWQLVAGIDNAELVNERPASRPNPSVIVRQELVDGATVEVIWAWLPESRRAKLVTVFFRD
jgi:hypothetical protein